MYTFFNSLLDPLVLFWLLIAASIILRICKKNKIANSIMVVGIFWMFMINISPFSQWMVYRLESKYAPLQHQSLEIDSSVYILVLGGGHTNAPGLPPGSQLSSPALVRLAEGIRLHRQIPGSKLVCSGNSTSGRTTQAEMLANAAIDLGVNPADTLQNRLPQNTAEEIRSYKNRFQKNGTLILVTSAYHMPRAMILCEKEGLKAIPAPTDFYIKNDPLQSNFDFYPYALKINMVESALHEYAGILKVKWID